jgi:hypothetical protein
MRNSNEFVLNVESISRLKKWKPTISLHEVSEVRLFWKTAKCFVEIVIGEKVINKGKI